MPIEQSGNCKQRGAYLYSKLKHECVARLALLDGEWPYTIPLNYALVEDGNDLYLYFHGTSEGKNWS